jgi:[acyl-carrier-protein] S-malonyltransferase
VRIIEFNGCQAVAGLSLGEYTALVFAEVMGFADGLLVVQERGRAMQDAADAASSGMVSILGMEREPIKKLCDEARGPGEVLQIANFLCPGNIVVSGHKTACERIADLATKAGAMKTIPLAVAGAFHTRLMQPAVERLKKALAGVTLKKPRFPVISNVDAAAHDDRNKSGFAHAAGQFRRFAGRFAAASREGWPALGSRPRPRPPRPQAD